MAPDSVSDIDDVNMRKKKKKKPLKLYGIKESLRQKKAFTDIDLM